MDISVSIRMVQKHKALCCHCAWPSQVGKDRATPCKHFPWTCAGVVPICVPCPHWVDGGAGYPGQGLVKSSLCRSHPAWVCLNGTGVSPDQTLHTQFSMNPDLIQHVPVHFSEWKTAFYFVTFWMSELSFNVTVFFCHSWLFYPLHAASSETYFVMMNY